MNHVKGHALQVPEVAGVACDAGDALVRGLLEHGIDHHDLHGAAAPERAQAFPVLRFATQIDHAAGAARGDHLVHDVQEACEAALPEGVAARRVASGERHAGE